MLFVGSTYNGGKEDGVILESYSIFKILDNYFKK